MLSFAATTCGVGVVVAVVVRRIVRAVVVGISVGVWITGIRRVLGVVAGWVAIAVAVSAGRLSCVGDASAQRRCQEQRYDCDCVTSNGYGVGVSHDLILFPLHR